MVKPDLTTTRVKMDSLEKWPGNARRGVVAGIKESIRVNGVFQPLIVQKSTDRIIAGNHRYMAMAELHEEDPEAFGEYVDVIKLDVNDTRATKMNLADNKTSDDATWDNQALLDQLLDLQAADGDLLGTGFADDDVEDLRDAIDDAILSEGAPGSMDLAEKPEDDNYVEQYAVIVTCRDEEHQEQVFEALQEQGYTVKVVTV